jgi:hypothetical protein
MIKNALFAGKCVGGVFTLHTQLDCGLHSNLVVNT